MAVLYTSKDIQRALKELRIQPEEGEIDTGEATRVLTWRAKKEQDIERNYDDSAIRRHVRAGNLVARKVNARSNRYAVEAVFALPLAPKRGIRYKEPITS